MSRSKRKVNRKGRNTNARFILLDFALLRTPAYRSLSCGARAMLVEFNMLYNGSNNGELFLSHRKAAEAVGVTSHAAAARYISELIDRRFIRIKTKGAFSRKTRHATTYVLTQHPYNDLGPSRDFRHWLPSKEKSRARKATATGANIDPTIIVEWPDGCDLVAH